MLGAGLGGGLALRGFQGHCRLWGMGMEAGG